MAPSSDTGVVTPAAEPRAGRATPSLQPPAVPAQAPRAPTPHT